ncbi:MAG TPA: hypothetical protein HA367_01010 [Candidatus Methanofastidiosum sp.]|jgi:hypothetical protein|nr:hypothetical protein [Methanofastidiosum sp.]
MEKNEFDEDLFNFYSQLIHEEKLIKLLRDILDNKDDDEVISQFIEEVKREADDQS